MCEMPTAAAQGRRNGTHITVRHWHWHWHCSKIVCRICSAIQHSVRV